MNEEQARALLENYRNGSLTDEERAILESWYLAQVSDPQRAPHDEVLRFNLQRIRHEINNRTKPRKVAARYIWAAAAAIVIMATMSWLFVRNHQDEYLPYNNMVEYGVLPGGNKATLTLADGNTIQLSANRHGIIVAEDGISYSDGSVLMPNGGVDGITASADGQPAQLAVSTPRGGTYRVELADGTNIWLNAGSTLRYPIRFHGPERVVELEGEAYFEVKKTTGKPTPFIVKIKGQDIRVLGTEFNVSAYPNDLTVRTVLVEGAVQIAVHHTNREVLLKPGEEAVLADEDIQIHQANIASVTAWKSGKFRFDDTELHEIMNQVSRWYDVEVEYRDKITNTYFYGVINRDQPLAGVLEVLREGGVNFNVEYSGNTTKLIVLP